MAGGGRDSLVVSSIGYAELVVATDPAHQRAMLISLKRQAGALKTVVVGVSRKPGRSFMEQVIAHKEANNPDRITGFRYRRYSRNELDIDQLDFSKAKGRGLKSLVLQTYGKLDSSARKDRQLPIYFEEVLTSASHTAAPAVNTEQLISRKTLGLSTDALLQKLNKFGFQFNIYDDWLQVFDQTYASPLNSHAFSYYHFFQGDTLEEAGGVIQQIRFVPIRKYERAFTGVMWINRKNFAVETISMNLPVTANLNFIKDLDYTEEYRPVEDSVTGRQIYLPYEYTSVVQFESGADLLGIPVSGKKHAVRLGYRSTSTRDQIRLHAGLEQAGAAAAGRPVALTKHEENIYRLADTLKKNVRFQRNLKLAAFAGTGSWNFGNIIRVGPYASLLSLNPLEQWRLRLGFWTLPGVSGKLNIFGYGAYGTRDQRIKGQLGMKYIWNATHWTKTTLSYSSDYDFSIDQDDELDKDNMVNSLFRKNIPFTRTYIRQALLKHEQYLSANWSARATLSYKELVPVFAFRYRPINPVSEKPYDSLYQSVLPVAEAGFMLRYAHDEQATVVNYDRIPTGSFFPVLTLQYNYGFELGKAQFDFHTVRASLEQQLRLPPKSWLYYKIEAGRVWGTVPYLLLNIPAGNEYYVASRYQFNTMAPYEFVSDRYVSLHSRLHIGGLIMDRIPLIRKLGWRERVSFNGYWGGLSASNRAYNKGADFSVTGPLPFMEASAGIENIFHILSVEYYRRLSYLNQPYAVKSGVYLGLTLAF